MIVLKGLARSYIQAVDVHRAIAVVGDLMGAMKDGTIGPDYLV